jgi:hypothetical protein
MTLPPLFATASFVSKLHRHIFNISVLVVFCGFFARHEKFPMKNCVNSGLANFNSVSLASDLRPIRKKFTSVNLQV